MRLVRFYIELGETENAKSQFDYMKRTLEPISAMSVWHRINEITLKAMLFRAQKKYEESIDLFEKALQESESTKADVWDAYNFARRVLCEYARAYLERDEEGDREKANKLLNQALEMLQKMGAKKDVEKTMRLMESSQLAPQVQTGEKSISPAGHVCEEVQGNIIVSPRELKVGESLELEIAVKNTSKEGTILLTKIAEAIPEGFAVAKKPELSHVEGDCLNITDKRLEPSKTEVVKLVLTPKAQGTFQIKPKIMYVDENGKEKTCEPKPISVTVKELGLRGWLKGER